MSYTVAFANQKGGTGKTTTVVNLAGVLSEQGKKVLLVDADPQGSLSVGFGVDVANLDKTVFDVMVNGIPIDEILMAVRDNIDLAPTNIYLSVAELQLAGEIRREDRLKNALAEVKGTYDFVFIDCPPSLGLLTINALSAADKVAVPMSCDFYALVGVRLLLDTISRIKRQLNPDLEILGVIPTRYDARTIHSQEVLANVRERLGDHVKVFDTTIRETVRFKEAPIEGLTITEYRTKHAGAEDYRQLAKEFLNEFN